MNNRSDIQAYHSKFKFRYGLMLPVALLAYVLSSYPDFYSSDFVSSGDDSYRYPPSLVISGDEIPASHVRYLQKKKVLTANEEIEQFYPAGIHRWKEYGYGFTQKTVFSYWQEGDNFFSDKAAFEDIKSIKVEEEDDDLYIIDIFLYDGSDFMLVISNIDNEGKAFAQALQDILGRYQTE